MATLKDVAKLANVDVSTVSRALNNTSYVHPETKARILAAVKELSYRPNVLAQGLRRGKRHTVGVVVPRLSLTIFAEIMQGIDQEARRRGYETLLCTTEDDPKIERECLGRLRSGFVDGIIFSGSGKSSRLLRDIHAEGIAVTQIVRCQDAMLNSVTGDYETSGYEAVKYLAAKGCREIGLINGSTELSPYRQRYAGYRRALDELGLPEISAVSAQPNNSFDYGYQCAGELLDRNPRLDGLMAAVDIQGMGALRALKERSLAVPGRVRLISLTGHSIGGLLETGMTALELPAHEMGISAAAMLIEDIEAPASAGARPRHLTFNATLVERESS